jgi:hypothetical protein
VSVSGSEARQTETDLDDQGAARDT